MSRAIAWLSLGIISISIAPALAADTASTSPAPAAIVKELRNDPAFMKAMVEELKRDPAFMDAVVDEWKRQREEKAAQNAQVAPAGYTTDTTELLVKNLLSQADAIHSPLELSTGSPLFPAKIITDDTGTSSAIVADALGGGTAAAPPYRPAVASKSVVQVEATTGASTATITYVVPLEPVFPGAGDVVYQPGIVLKASAPIDNKDQGSSTFASLNGAATGLTIGGDLTLTRMPSAPGGNFLPDICHTLEIPFDQEHPKSCTAQNVISVLERVNNPAAKAAFDTYVRGQGYAQVFDVHASLTNNTFKYYNDSLSQQTAAKLGWGAGGLVGLVTPDRTEFLSVGFDFLRSYKEATDSVECTLAATQTFPCTSGKLSAPKTQNHRVVYFEARDLFAVADHTLPVSLRLAHDFAGDGADSIDMPIYLFQDKDSAFTGGVRFGWTTLDHFLGGVFVGKQFDLVPSQK